MAERLVSKEHDYEIRALNKVTEQRGMIGKAYIQEHGRIRLWFNPFVQLPTGSEVVVSLFPVDSGAESSASKGGSRYKRGRKTGRRTPHLNTLYDYDDEIPL